MIGGDVSFEGGGYIWPLDGSAGLRGTIRVVSDVCVLRMVLQFRATALYSRLQKNILKEREILN